jgi:tRNA(fMet)-specific endonuclease VapC
MLLLDSNVCIDILRSRATIDHLPFPRDCILSTIVLGELWVGIAKSDQRALREKKLQDFTELFISKLFDEDAAWHYGEIRAYLEKKGTPIGPMDQLIAAHARSLGATLLTANLTEFRRVPGLKCRAWRR